MKNQMTSTKYIAAALFLSVAFLVTATEATAQTFPPGNYLTTITAADIPPGFPPEVIPLLLGDWYTEYTASGSYVVTKDGEIVSVGRYVPAATRLVMRDLYGPLACKDDNGIATGIYHWSFENNELTLTAINDRCFGRAMVLTAHPLVAN